MRAAYYNETDAEKAAWIRELIKAGVVAPGDVDERSISDVRADDLRGYTQCHFFAGIGVWSYALRLAGWPDDRPVWTGSCPCPSFSCAGKGEGFDDARHLWPAWYSLIRQCRPGTVFGEQVAAAIGHGWLDLVSGDMEAAEYAITAAVLGAHSSGAPHIRQRLYFCAYANRGGTGAQSGDHREAGKEAIRDLRTDDSAALRLRSGDAGERADPERDGRRSDLAQREAQGRTADGRDCTTGDLCHPSLGGLAMRGSAPGNGGHAARTSEPGDVREWRGPGWLDPITARSVAAAGATRGFWADCDWWYGRDGKYRPIEPGIFPLAHGAAARVLQLRGYGDAICAETAAHFIACCAGIDDLTQTPRESGIGE